MAGKKAVGYKEVQQADLLVHQCTKCRFQTPHKSKIKNHVQNKHGYDLSITPKPAGASKSKKESD